jgi:Ca2+-binding RTX toxin-like protein
VVGVFLIGCAVLVVAGCAGVRSQAPQKEEQGNTEATASEKARCSDAVEETRTIKKKWVRFTTNDVPGVPNKGGLLCGTDGGEELHGELGDDEIHGLDGKDYIDGGGGTDIIYAGPGDDGGIWGGRGDDVIYGGPGNDAEEADLVGGGGDDVIYGGDGNDNVDADQGEDVVYGGDGNDFLGGYDDGEQPDKLYCGEGRDKYIADKNDYVDSCEKKVPPAPLLY